jgi:hypothetical protein
MINHLSQCNQYQKVNQGATEKINMFKDVTADDKK